MHFLASVFTGFAFAAASFLPFLHGGSATSTRPFDEKHIATSTPPGSRTHQSDIASSTVICVGSAVQAREQSIDTAETSLTSALNSAYSARASALASAYSLAAGSSAVSAGVRAAWQAFASSTESAQSSWKRRRMTAWQTFMTAARACKAPPSVLDSSDSVLENAGQ